MKEEKVKYPEMVMMGERLFAGINEDDVTEIKESCSLIVFHEQGQMGKLHNALTRLDELDEIDELRKEVERLKAEALPKESGTNEYGLDLAYFRRTINRELNRDISRFKPDEIARVFARLSIAADKAVIHETEFKSPLKPIGLKRFEFIADSNVSYFDILSDLTFGGHIEAGKMTASRLNALFAHERQSGIRVFSALIELGYIVKEDEE